MSSHRLDGGGAPGRHEHRRGTPGSISIDPLRGCACAAGAPLLFCRTVPRTPYQRASAFYGAVPPSWWITFGQFHAETVAQQLMHSERATTPIEGGTTSDSERAASARRFRGVLSAPRSRHMPGRSTRRGSKRAREKCASVRGRDFEQLFVDVLDDQTVVACKPLPPSRCDPPAWPHAAPTWPDTARPATPRFAPTTRRRLSLTERQAGDVEQRPGLSSVQGELPDRDTMLTRRSARIRATSSDAAPCGRSVPTCDSGRDTVFDETPPIRCQAVRRRSR